MKLKLVFLLILPGILSGCFLFNSSKGDSDDSEREDIDEGFGADFGEMELLSEAIRSYDAERYSISRNMFDKLTGKYPSSPLSVFAELKIADSIFYADKYLESIPFYREFIRIHTTHEALPYAHYQIAQAYMFSYQGTGHDETPLKEAKKIYEMIRNDYPGSRWADFAKEQILACDTKLFESEMEVIKFYEKKGQDAAARARLESAKSNFSHLESIEEVSDTEDENSISSKKNRISQNKFLKYAHCESSDERTILKLDFLTKPYLMSSTQSEKHTDSLTPYQNTLVFSDGLFNDLESEGDEFTSLADIPGSEINFKVCGSAIDKLYLYEFTINNPDEPSRNYIALKANSKVKKWCSLASLQMSLVYFTSN
jgi:outer membrane assembly lipoprotein YfiO